MFCPVCQQVHVMQTLANTALDGLFCKWLICGWWFHSGLQAATAAPLTPWPSLKFDPQNDQNCMDHFWTCWIICGCLLPMYGIVRNSWHCKKCACLAVISLAGKGTYRGHYNWNLITWLTFKYFSNKTPQPRSVMLPIWFFISLWSQTILQTL